MVLPYHLQSCPYSTLRFCLIVPKIPNQSSMADEIVKENIIFSQTAISFLRSLLSSFYSFVRRIYTVGKTRALRYMWSIHRSRSCVHKNSTELKTSTCPKRGNFNNEFFIMPRAQRRNSIVRPDPAVLEALFDDQEKADSKTLDSTNITSCSLYQDEPSSAFFVPEEETNDSKRRVSFSENLETIHLVDNLRTSLNREERYKLWIMPETERKSLRNAMAHAFGIDDYEEEDEYYPDDYEMSLPRISNQVSGGNNTKNKRRRRRRGKLRNLSSMNTKVIPQEFDQPLVKCRSPRKLRKPFKSPLLSPLKSPLKSIRNKLGFGKKNTNLMIPTLQ